MPSSIKTTFAITILFFISCTSSKQLANTGDISHLKFLSEYDIPYNKEFQNTVVGGLSSIDYDAANNIYYVISDDRSERNAARFYKAQINISNNKIDSVHFLEAVFLKNKEGKIYPGVKTDPSHTPDPEALRYNPRTQTLTWSSEGERIVKDNNLVLEDPSVTDISLAGNYLDTFEIPSQMHMRSQQTGPRRNGVFEGLAFADNYKYLFVNVEEPLYNDGSRAGLNDSTGIIRIIKFDAGSKKALAEYAYTIDPVAYPPNPEDAFIINGIPDILSLGKNKLLVTERSFSTGRAACTIRLYLADLSHAEDVSRMNSIKDKAVKMVTKKLLLNMDDLKIYIDNIEGATFGPTLANGHRSLLFISDNNFDSRQKTQVLLFEVD
ncbi:MAG: esterase-like activity of phytase family protein [Ginsengibacter sp.]